MIYSSWVAPTIAIVTYYWENENKMVTLFLGTIWLEVSVHYFVQKY